MTEAPDAEAAFKPLRPGLLRIAYRMLGSVADAEDMVQEAFLRWLAAAAQQAAQEANRAAVREPAAFLLHDVFGASFDEVAATIGRAPAACRQLAARARAHLRAARPRFPVAKERGLEIAAAFFAASRAGDMRRLRALLAADVTLYADGGGKIPAALNPILGSEKVLRLFAALAPRFAARASRLARYGVINGLPGFVTIEEGEVLQTTALQLDGDRLDGEKIVAIYVIRNPDKLRHIAASSIH
jgi:RNA polymerase sigma-70 factor, ECF subfamily